MMTSYEASHVATGAVDTAQARILFATDPICSHCWAMEPAWRRFLYHYGEYVEATHLYGGLLHHWEGFADVRAGIRGPEDIPPHWEEVAARYGQPIDPSVWLADPLPSSYPPRWPCTRCEPSPRSGKRTTCAAFDRRSSWRRATSRGPRCSS